MPLQDGDYLPPNCSIAAVQVGLNHGLKLGKGQIPAICEEGGSFLRWSVELGDNVTEGQSLAVFHDAAGDEFNVHGSQKPHVTLMFAGGIV